MKPCDGNCFECVFDDCILGDDLTFDDIKISREIEAAANPKTQKELAIAAKQREYRERNREEIAAYKREYYERNREEIAAYKREYYERNREEIAAKQRVIYDYRRERGLPQRAFAKLLGVSRQTVSLWENGLSPADWDLIMSVFPELCEAAV